MKAEFITPTSEFIRRFSSTRRSARLARHLVVERLDAWGIPPTSVPSDITAVIVGELAANAVTHGRVPGRDFELRLVLTAESIRIEVADGCSEKRPDTALRQPPADAESGRGLLMLEALAARWGISDRDGPGKVVWAEVPRPPVPAPADRAQA
ncbi:ATP-binding protein [Streptomyces pactum]|uniref:ATP-binding protein n=1 Tax=Streptomyces pactum TaxID=68249 RepID=A0ABS0NGJ0_9ACTN|nr:ATP-binding protein [Streptomyces pactum]MBH5334312.1 ATP-binding protein [Streptomyces pactum]